MSDREEEIAALVRQYLRGGTIPVPLAEGSKSRSGDVESSPELAVVHAVTVLYAKELPDQFISAVMCWSASEIERLLRELRTRLPSSAAARVFLRNSRSRPPQTPEPVTVPDDAAAALKALDYWTDLWLSEDGERLGRTASAKGSEA